MDISILPFIRFPLQHHLITKYSTTDLFLDNCQSSHSQLSKTEFILIGLKQQLSKIQNCSLMTTHCAGNLGFIFDALLTLSDQITELSKSCYYHIRELRCIRLYLDFKTASTIATSIAHLVFDYCNSLYHNLPNCQLNRLQLIQNSLACAVVKAFKSTYITPILKSLHWLKANERIEYKLISLT